MQPVLESDVAGEKDVELPPQADMAQMDDEERKVRQELGLPIEGDPPAQAKPPATEGQQPHAPADELPPAGEPPVEEKDDLLPPPDAEVKEIPSKPTPAPAITDDTVIEYPDDKGQVQKRTIKEVRESMRRIHGMDAEHEELRPYREMRAALGFVKNPERKAKMTAELLAVMKRFRAEEEGKAPPPSAPAQRDPEVDEAVTYVKSLKEEREQAKQRAAEREEYQRNVRVARSRMELAVRTAATHGVTLDEAQRQKLANRCMQIQQHARALYEKDPRKAEILFEMSMHPAQIWLEDNIKTQKVASLKASDKAHLDALRKGVVNPPGSPSPAPNKPPLPAKSLKDMTPAEMDKLSDAEFEALSHQMRTEMAQT
jgi:hypothetical protein